MPASQLVPMQAHHLPQVVAIEARVQFSPWRESMFQDCLGGRYFSQVALEGEQVVGFSIWDAVLDEGTLHNIAVTPAMQGRAIGQQLLCAGLAWASEHSLGTLFLEVRESNVAARNLYKKHGFNVVGKRKGYYQAATGREDALVMQLELR